ncbi:hypothetical protein H5410_058682 [Solanum commersonii]|uniref:Uncharacterized protein n=1 Tax=Solanum commersonii TaxID=4109 RepID=A0A9J5WTW3_SOLCO|nr:hypothetical protein H5410_058682 [Solanum commersonii]
MVRRGKIPNAALASHHTSLTRQRDFLRSLCSPLLRPFLHDGACFQFSTNMVNKLGMKVRLDTQIIPKRGRIKYFRSLTNKSKKMDISMMMSHIVLVQGGWNGDSTMKSCTIRMYYQNLKVNFTKQRID